MNAPITVLEGYAQSLALEVAALKADLSQDPQWCERTRARLLAVWGGEIPPNEFLDQFVQTLTVTFLLAKNSAQYDISEKNLEDLLPPNIPVLSELIRLLFLHVKEDSKTGAAFSRLIQILNTQPSAPMIPSAIPASVYSYEHFLQAYSPQSRRERGVFYTPPEIVEFIVKNVQIILQKDLGMSGLCDKSTRLVDFSAGTGAFLFSAIKQGIGEIPHDLNQDSVIREKILPHFVGLEPFLAPNIIAQLNIVKLLQDPPITYRFAPKEHLNLYPYNTLEDPQKDQIFAPAPPFAKIFPVIIGNPPYAADSHNNNPWILGLLGTYKEGLVEKNLKPLNDDYVKFLRYAQWRVEKAGQGIIGIITNNSFLDGLVHRVMRASLLRSFNRLYLFNLHGHQREDGDESVFNIQKVGVVICIFIKMPTAPESKEVYYFSSHDHGLNSRAEKLDFLRTHHLENIPWTRLEAHTPHYWFKPQSSQEEAGYLAGWGLDEIFEVYSSGIETGNDAFYTALSSAKDDLISRVRDTLLSQNELTIKKKYNWLDTTNRTLQKLRLHGRPDNISNAILPLHYRPLDIRWCYYEKGAMSRDRYDIMQHLLGPKKGNLAIISVRQVGGQDSFTHILVTNLICDNRIMKSTKGKAYIFPLFLCTESFFKPNFRKEFLQTLADLYGTTPNAEELFAFIYAVLNSPFYRKQYDIQLRKNFPRVVFLRDLQQFKAIAKEGRSLIDAHLFRTSLTQIKGIKFNGNDNSTIKKQHIRYEPALQRLWINEIEYWEGISPEIWNMQIGGWPVLSRWLSERHGQTIVDVGQENFEHILCALKHALVCCAKIDTLLSMNPHK